MAKDPGIGFKVVATITDKKGTCSAGHEVGESFEISCQNLRCCAAKYLFCYWVYQIVNPARTS
mgnify:CR=1 FL=1